jgi:predicted lipoprotein with Yx(FWY)xxD motif
MTHWKLVLGALVSVWIWGVSPGATQPLAGAMVRVAPSSPQGAYLTDANGRALYLFTADTPGTEAVQAVSRCDGACRQAWPPLLAQGTLQAGAGVQVALLGTLRRQDGALQVTYNGWPLYYAGTDHQPGQVTGQGIQSFGGTWALVQPQGTQVTAAPRLRPPQRLRVREVP